MYERIFCFVLISTKHMLTTVFLPIFHQRQAVPSPFYMLHVCVHKLLKKRQKLYDN